MWINNKTDEKVSDYNDMVNIIEETIDDYDEFENYLINNNFTESVLDLALDGKTWYRGVVTNFNILVDCFREDFIQENWDEWEYFEPDAECLQYESDD